MKSDGDEKTKKREFSEGVETGRTLIASEAKAPRLDWKAALDSLGGNEMNKAPDEPRRPGIHTVIAMLRQPIDRGPAQVRQRYLAHAMKNVAPLMTILEGAPDAHLRWLAAQAIAAYGTFLMQRFWTSRDFAWGNRWDSVIPHAIVMLDTRQPFMKRAVSWLGVVWAGDVKKSASALLGRLTDSNTSNGTTTSGLIAEAGAIPLLVKVLREGTLEGAFASRNVAYTLRNLIREPIYREQVFMAGAIGPLDTLLAVGLPDGKAIAARTLQKLADPVEGADPALVVQMQTEVAKCIGLPSANYAAISAELKKRCV